VRAVAVDLPVSQPVEGRIPHRPSL
jgi:hypothetical protein